jgi:hypothetical protein
MKKMILFALLLAVVAASASAQVSYVKPKCNVAYKCYYENYPDPITNGGLSIFGDCVWVRSDFLRGIEQYQVPYGNKWDGRMFAFAKPVNGPDPYYGQPMTTWEFTINPYGPQCKRTEVMFGGDHIEFKDCTDGHARYCTKTN